MGVNNGGIIGKLNSTSAGSAVGRFSLNEVQQGLQGGVFPLQVIYATVLIVAGGGGGGSSGANYCGGGGAGGCLYYGTETSTNASGTPKTPNGGVLTLNKGSSFGITVGTGGPANTSGTNSVAFGYTAIGGGFGRGNAYASSGGTGGSGGGATPVNGVGGAGTAGQGFKGGNASSANQGGGDSGAGGGGGAQGQGDHGDSFPFTNAAAAGGQGVQYAITGTAAYYAAGGAGSGFYAAGSTNGIGGATSGGAAAASTGSGGGGGRSGGGGSGSDGIVIVRYQSAVQLATGGTVTSYSSGGLTYWVHSFTTSGTLTT